ncbi:hypothetical protein JF732_21605 [Mycobacterium intracellulare]|uniref:Uncharacterized protein n=1 Tax=Mycobacterium intracellulare TaxID=1767 RepID=A0AAE4UBP6_MYCIT|nr:hypothetical protein [Mycobacterium intracellulare]MCA2322551.1 hypothetical protein [Mycobacterium intracellulare]MCA2343130.1 hypothetical protein [Mycobacterium intracellulare]MDV6978029.1 hypothetical protein [Mycobacterium intracellulare]MDV6983443.1 hypothetical protein [Mycobacterium intracellulare]MDV7012192.1 hypothetical protein [Mycobacterium intracellulare]
MTELRESVEPSGRAGNLGVDTSWVDVDFSASQFVIAGPPELVLLGKRGESIESDAPCGIAAGARWRCPVLLASPRPADGSMVCSLAALTLCPLTAFLLFVPMKPVLPQRMTPRAAGARLETT